MGHINDLIISEINGLNNTSPEGKSFLKWLLEFERDNIDKERYDYKQDINKKVEELLTKPNE